MVILGSQLMVTITVSLVLEKRDYLLRALPMVAGLCLPYLMFTVYDYNYSDYFYNLFELLT